MKIIKTLLFLVVAMFIMELIDNSNLSRSAAMMLSFYIGVFTFIISNIINKN